MTFSGESGKNKGAEATGLDDMGKVIIDTPAGPHKNYGPAAGRVFYGNGALPKITKGRGPIFTAIW